MTQILSQALLPPSNLLSPGYPGLFVHTGPAHSTPVAALCGAEGAGAVIAVPGPADPSRMRAFLYEAGRHGGNPAHVLFDAEDYTGTGRSRGADAMDPSWVRRQVAAGCEWGLTNSGYIGSGDVNALDDVLKAGRSSGGQTIVALPLHASWLQQRVPALADKITDAGQPVALMIEHASDPFGVRANVRGLVDLLDRVEVPVLLLRSDLSSLAAVAWGASAGAIGTTTTRRHIWPSKKGGGFRPPSVAAYVPSLMSFNRLGKINDALLYGTDPMWECRCGICFGRSLSWIATAEEAFQHSLSSIASLAREVFDPSLNEVQRRQGWISRCQAAQTRSFEASDLARTEWRPPNFLGAWNVMAPAVP